LNYNSKVAAIDTQIDQRVVTLKDFRDANDGSSFNFQNNITVQAVPVPSRVNLQSFCRTNITIADKYLITASFRDGTSRFTGGKPLGNSQL
jgi:iron complex outermembrane receptor protein